MTDNAFLGPWLFEDADEPRMRDTLHKAGFVQCDTQRVCAPRASNYVITTRVPDGVTTVARLHVLDSLHAEHMVRNAVWFANAPTREARNVVYQFACARDDAIGMRGAHPCVQARQQYTLHVWVCAVREPQHVSTVVTCTDDDTDDADDAEGEAASAPRAAHTAGSGRALQAPVLTPTQAEFDDPHALLRRAYAQFAGAYALVRIVPPGWRDTRLPAGDACMTEQLGTVACTHRRALADVFARASAAGVDDIAAHFMTRMHGATDERVERGTCVLDDRTGAWTAAALSDRALLPARACATVGTRFASAAFRVADAGLCAVHVHVHGAPVERFGVAAHAADALPVGCDEAAMRADGTPAAVAHLLPARSLCTTRQHAGDIVVVFPGACAADVFHGAAVCETITLATPDWMPHGVRAIERDAALHRPPACDMFALLRSLRGLAPVDAALRDALVTDMHARNDEARARADADGTQRAYPRLTVGAQGAAVAQFDARVLLGRAVRVHRSDGGTRAACVTDVLPRALRVVFDDMTSARVPLTSVQHADREACFASDDTGATEAPASCVACRRLLPLAYVRCECDPARTACFAHAADMCACVPGRRFVSFVPDAPPSHCVRAQYSVARTHWHARCARWVVMHAVWFDARGHPTRCATEEDMRAAIAAASFFSFGVHAFGGKEPACAARARNLLRTLFMWCAVCVWWPHAVAKASKTTRALLCNTEPTARVFWPGKALVAAATAAAATDDADTGSDDEFDTTASLTDAAHEAPEIERLTFDEDGASPLTVRLLHLRGSTVVHGGDLVARDIANPKNRWRAFKMLRAPCEKNKAIVGTVPRTPTSIVLTAAGVRRLLSITSGCLQQAPLASWVRRVLLPRLTA